jgi:hypothetical protein
MSQQGSSSSQRDTSATRAPDSGKYSAKPDFFNGGRTKLDDWLKQLMIYFALEGIQAEQRKVFMAISYMSGEAQQWIRPRLQRVVTEGDENKDRMFKTFDHFKDEVKAIYGLSNEQQVAIRSIHHVTQKTSAALYTAKFKEYATKTGWDKKALITMYYQGLKDNVKDELMRSAADQSTLENMVKAAIEIDDRLYERQMEKRHTGQFRGRSGYNPNSWTERNSRRDPNAMELDATIKGPKRGKKGKNRAKKQDTKKREGPKCYNCQKPGHFARECRGRKVQPQQLNMALRTTQTSKEECDVTAEEPRHNTLGWTACYDDDCLTHINEKNGAGWFPRKPRRQEFNMMTITEKRGRSPAPRPALQQTTGNKQFTPPPLRREEATLQENQQPSVWGYLEEPRDETLLDNHAGNPRITTRTDSRGRDHDMNPAIDLRQGRRRIG